jgi:sigma-B regulation protein RsbU (phosphoserine phosphatase)
MAKHDSGDSTQILKRTTRVLVSARDQPAAHYVVLAEGTEAGRKVELTAQGITIGRAADNRLVLSDPFVSGHHCQVRVSEERIWVEDLGSTNGTFINDVRISGTVEWPMYGALRLGNQLLRLEFRHRKGAREEEALSEELRRAAGYVQSLLPSPLLRGPIKATWKFQPSVGLGGDIFDYFWLDTEHFAFYLLDASGHGPGAALHSTSVFNLLRQRSLTGADFRQPGSVLTALNRSLPMDRYGDMYFTVGYGVYRPQNRQLRFASAGHPPALLFDSGGSLLRRMETADPPIGVVAEVEYGEAIADVPPSSLLYLYSDGLYEFTTSAGEAWSCDELASLLARQLASGQGQPEQVFQQVRQLAGTEQVEDDVSLLRIGL